MSMICLMLDSKSQEDRSRHQKQVDFVFSCQTPEGDIRGILGTQYMPYYHGVITELLTRAGYAGDPRLERGLTWLLSMRQQDGAWIVPMQAVPASEKTRDCWSAPPLPPDRALPFSHLATGMVLRAFAAHPIYRCSKEARLAGEQLKSRFFRPDKYNDRKASSYWTKFQYPFWWTNILTSLDSLSLMGFAMTDPDMRKGLDWFVSNQEKDGLWPNGYGSGSKVERERRWIGLATCRVFKRLYG